jgi:isocitrate dehydrogenase kinase/phosphatase
MESKYLYNFTIFEDKESFVEETSVNEENGEETIVKKKTIEKSPVQIFIKKPSRRQIEDADLEYSVEISKCIKRGILTKAMLAKKYSDTGGAMSEQESTKLVDLYKSIYDSQSQLDRLQAISQKTEEIESKITETLILLQTSRKEIVEIESSYRSLFDHTADSKAQNKVLVWYILNLAYIKKPLDPEPKPYFSGSDFEEKLQDFYEKEESADQQYFQISKKLSTLMAFWFFNQASTTQDFEELDRKIESGEL